MVILAHQFSDAVFIPGRDHEAATLECRFPQVLKNAPVPLLGQHDVIHDDHRVVLRQDTSHVETGAYVGDVHHQCDKARSLDAPSTSRPVRGSC